MNSSWATLSTNSWTEVVDSSDYLLISCTKGVAYFCYSDTTPTEATGVHTVPCNQILPKGTSKIWLMAGAQDTKVAYTGIDTGLINAILRIL